MGAEYIERHFTILKPNESRDGQVSITPQHLRELTQFANMSRDQQKVYLDEKVPEFQSMLGSETRELSHAELLNRAYYRGRFATHVGGKVVYNWEDTEI